MFFFFFGTERRRRSWRFVEQRRGQRVSTERQRRSWRFVERRAEVGASSLRLLLARWSCDTEVATRPRPLDKRTSYILAFAFSLRCSVARTRYHRAARSLPEPQLCRPP